MLTLHDARYGIDGNDAEYARKQKDWKSLESLAKTITDDQLINPIFVYRYGNKCRLIAGERRTLASAIAGKNEIIARIASQRPVGTKLKVLQWIENNERVDLSLAERIASLEAILAQHFAENMDNAEHKKERITSKLLSELTGMSMTQARRYTLIFQASPSIKQGIASGQIENLKLLELILSTENEKDKHLLFDAAIAGHSFDEIVQMKKGMIAGATSRVKKEVVKRKRQDVCLGYVKPDVAILFFNALLASKILKDSVIKQLHTIKEATQWNNRQSIEKSFTKIMSMISEEV